MLYSGGLFVDNIQFLTISVFFSCIYLMFILVSKADKIFLTQDRVLHRGALDAAQCHRAYAQVTMPFGLGWIRAFNEPFLRKGDDG